MSCHVKWQSANLVHVGAAVIFAEYGMKLYHLAWPENVQAHKTQLVMGDLNWISSYIHQVVAPLNPTTLWLQISTYNCPSIWMHFLNG
jgi:hypothetical protein